MNELTRRNFIRGIGSAIIAGYTPPFVPGLMAPLVSIPVEYGSFDKILKAHFSGKIEDHIFAENPLMKRLKPDGGGKVIKIPFPLK